MAGQGNARTQPWQATSGGVLLFVRLTPKARSEEVSGTADGPDGVCVVAKVRAVPDKGQANAALEKLIAAWLGVPQRDVALSAGGKSRSKTLKINGDPDALGRTIDARLAALDP